MTRDPELLSFLNRLSGYTDAEEYRGVSLKVEEADAHGATVLFIGGPDSEGGRLLGGNDYWVQVENNGVLEKELQGLHFKVYEKDGIAYATFRYGDIPFRFTQDAGTGKYEYVTINGKIDQLQEAPDIFGDYEKFINGRGYIWSRTLPQIVENPLFGTGPDTFLLSFPQNDYVVRSNLGHTFFTQMITNAHSLYMHMAVQTGIPSLICFLGFVFIYLRKSWKLYYGKEDYAELERIGIGIFLGIVGYLICGITFASSVCTTPIFWLLLGTGIGINSRLS